MSDLNQLNLREPDPTDWDGYEEGGGKQFVLPPKGIYTVVEEGPATVSAHKDGYLQFDLADLVIQDEGEFKGIKVRFARINLKPFAKRKGTSVGDYLRAHAYPGGAQSNQDYINVVSSFNGRPFRVGCDWDGYCKICKDYEKMPGKMESFPVVNGVRQSWMDCPNGCQDQTDPEKPRVSRVFANLKARFYVSALPKG